MSTPDDERASFPAQPAGTPDDDAHDAATDPPDETDRLPISLADVEALVRGVLARNVAALVEHSSALRTGDDPEDVHQARVALRRLRAAQRTFQPFFESWPEELGDRLRDAGRVLGTARDLDVLAERLSDHVDGLPASDGPAGDRILHHLNQQRFTARVTGIAYTTGPEWAALMRDLSVAAACPVSTPEGSDAGDILRATVRKQWGRVAKLAKVLDGGSDEELHELRIRAKRARYAAESVAPLFDDEPRGLASALADLQDALGRHHDAVWATAWLRKAAPPADPTVAFVAGELTGIEHAAAARARAREPRLEGGAPQAAPALAVNERVVRAAGGVVHRRVSDTEVLLVHRPKYDDWSFPKGKLDRGEREEDAALREVLEETGVLAVLGPEVATTSYRDASGSPKTVRYWAMTTVNGDTSPFRPNREVDELRWCSPTAAAALLTYAHDRTVLEAFVAQLAEQERPSGT